MSVQHLNEFGEPTTHVVVETWADVPESIRSHTLMGWGSIPGVCQHARLGIYIVVLDEVRRAVAEAPATRSMTGYESSSMAMGGWGGHAEVSE